VPCRDATASSRETGAVTRTRALLGLLVLAAAGIAIALIVAPGDDSSDHAATAPSTTTSTTPATTAAPSTTAPASTTTPPTTTTTSATPPGPCGQAQAAITTAIDAGVAGAAGGATIRECRLAASDTTWALARLEPSAGSGFAATTVVLHQSAGAWSVAATGGTGAGCGIAPQQVIADLGQFCVGNGAGAR
jgi:hypothetical protein